MSTKSFLKSAGTTIRRIEREAARQNREAIKKYKAQEKALELVNARESVEDWENYVFLLKNVHINCSEAIDWKKIKGTALQKPVKSFPNLQLAEEEKADYNPSFIEKITGLSKKKIHELEQNILDAKEIDEVENLKQEEVYNIEVRKHEALQKIAEDILIGKKEAFTQAFQLANPLATIDILGKGLEILIHDEVIEIYLNINSKEVIPSYEVNLTSTGKLSKKDLPKSRFNELYQDHICSAVLRIAREIFAFLPVDRVFIHCMNDVLDSSTGYFDKKPIFSGMFLKQILYMMKIDAIDPSDSMENFVHNMKFSKTKGFSVVEGLSYKV